VLLTGSSASEDRRHAMAALVYAEVGARDREAEQWLAAVNSSPKDTAYRLKAAESLRALGRHEEALRHVVLGNTLDSSNTSLKHLGKRIRHEIVHSDPSGR